MTNSNDVLKIDTPENVTFDYDVAGIGSRFLAALIDTALILIGQLLILGAAILVALIVFKTDLLGEDLFNWALAITGILSFIFLWGYYIFFEILWNGQTPGKRWVGLRVIRVDGTPITVGEAIIRNLVRIIDLLPTAYGIGVVTMFISPNSRRVGDLAAGTIVIHEREEKELKNFSPLTPVMINTWVSTNDVPEGFPIEKISQYEIQIMEEFLSRRRDLSNHQQLAQHILNSIATRLEIPKESIPYHKAEEVLAAIYKVIHNNKTK
ncbi:MAG: RDD family protein [Anaerolineales bacterium]